MSVLNPLMPKRAVWRGPYYLVIYQNVDQIFDPTLLNCYFNNTFQINSEMVIMYFNPSSKCKFTSENVEIAIGITSSRDLSQAIFWGYRIQNSTFTETTTKQTVECKLIEEREDCETKLQEFSKMQNIFVDFRIIVINSDGTDHFQVLYMDRYQSCFSHVGLTIIYKANANSGSFLLTNYPLNLPACNMISQTRQFIEISFYELLIPDGLITQINNKPFYKISMREDFSVSNSTIIIPDITDTKLVKRITSLMINKKLYCTLQYGDIQIPVLEYKDQTQIFSQAPIYIITAVSGIGVGIIYAFIEFIAGQCVSNRKVEKE